MKKQQDENFFHQRRNTETSTMFSPANMHNTFDIKPTDQITARRLSLSLYSQN